MIQEWLSACFKNACPDNKRLRVRIIQESCPDVTRIIRYKELSEIINAHNKFVEENPDYFPDDIAIDIINIDGSEWINSFFGNFTKDDIYPAELGINCNSISFLKHKVVCLPEYRP